MTTRPVNMDELNEIMDSDHELIRECFDDFITDYPGILADIRDAIDTENFEQLDDCAHKLKGSLKYLAAENAAQSALVLEQAGRNQDPDNLEDKFADIDTKCRQVIAFIKNYPV